MTGLRRRAVLLGLLAAAACTRPLAAPERREPTAPLPHQDAWEAEARAVLQDTLEALHTLEAFAAYRLSHALDAGQGSAAQLEWDPPGQAAWSRASELSRASALRALQLHQSVAWSVSDPALWRERRALAQSVHGVLDAANAGAAYRHALDGLGPDGPGTAVLGLLDRAWELWRAAAVAWSVDAAETIGGAG